MDALEAENRGYTNLNNYLEKVEKIWNEKSKGNVKFKDYINWRNKLKNQFPISKLKIVYTASGTNAAAAFLEDSKGIIDTKLYYYSVLNKNEGLYLEGILNSDYLMEKIKGLQSQGQWGTRDIHRHLLKPPIPKYDPKERLHKDIVDYTKKIKQIVQNVELDPSWNFITSRRKVRDKIKNTGKIWSHFNKLIEALLDGNQSSQTAS